MILTFTKDLIMSHNFVYEMVIKQFSLNLNALKNILQKSKAHAESLKFDADKFLDLKLAPDMFPLLKQIQITTDNAKGAAARLSGKENPVFADTEKTFSEIMDRVQKTIQFLETFKSEDFKDYEAKKITFPWYPGKHLDGKEYLNGFAIPNFYFHLTTAYDLLRQGGVALGKGDFIGAINWKS
jgi:hypothetical protein